MPKKTCPDGQIYRVPYKRRTSKGIVEVEGNCITDRGKPGKGPKTLPNAKEIKTKFHLSSYGYQVHASTKARRQALREAMLKEGIRAVGRHLNYYRNLQSVPENRKTMSDDVKYISEVYKIFKRMQQHHA